MEAGVYIHPTDVDITPDTISHVREALNHVVSTKDTMEIKVNFSCLFFFLSFCIFFFFSSGFF